MDIATGALSNASGRWIVARRARSVTRLRLLCFHYAGGAANAFAAWAKRLPAGVEVCAVELPGRGSRGTERPIDAVSRLMPELTAAVRPYLDLPFVAFGHSMGSLLAFELTRELRRRGWRTPRMLIASAGPAPHLVPAGSIHLASDAALIAVLRDYNRVPEVILSNSEWRALTLPALRADFALVERYRYHDEARLDVPIRVFGGQDDSSVPRTALAAWQDHTSSSFELRLFAGDHFYLRAMSESAFFDALSTQLEWTLQATP